jgi:hypothetical protein
MQRIPRMHCLILRLAAGRLRDGFVAWDFDRIAGLTKVPSAALCDKVKPSMLNHSRR